MTSTWEIRVSGRVPRRLVNEFDGLTVQARPVETVLTGTVVDQASLYGIITRLQALGLELVELRQTDPVLPPVVAEPRRASDGS